MTTAGLTLFAAWNLLMAAMLAMAIVALRGWERTRLHDNSNRIDHADSAAREA